MTTINLAKAPIGDVVAYLKAGLDQLDRDDRPFAYSLIGAAEGRGLTDKQAVWVRKMADRIANPMQARNAVQVGDVSGLLALFDKAAANGLKWPKLRIATEDGTILTLRRAGEKSRHVGQVMVYTRGNQPMPGLSDDRVYYGRVDHEGRFHPSQQASSAAIDQAIPALVAMATDPAKAGKAYGQRTGHCAFCSLPLDDKRSVDAGYGPVCAENFGLPWGHAKRRTAKGRA